MKPRANMPSLDQNYTCISKILCLFLFIVVERHVQNISEIQRWNMVQFPNFVLLPGNIPANGKQGS